MQIATGLDRLLQNDFSPILSKSIGVLCNQASVTHDYKHILQVLEGPHKGGRLQIKAIFGPQHGLFGHTQDNMIEWEPSKSPLSEVALHSLYGKHREPTEHMLEGIELLVIDLQEVGARYYTFIWTMALCLKACGERGIEVLILDRPNPIGGAVVEGTVMDPEFASFVGLYPLPMRHGMTLAEIARHLQSQYFQSVKLTSLNIEGWRRDQYLDQSDGPWAMPSPNMPTVDTAVVYPGACLLEATNLSEGRGTTRPFEIVGAPFIDGWKYCEALNRTQLPGVTFRPLQFEPTFQKHAKTICEGAFVHVWDRNVFQPVLTYVAVLQEARRLADDQFAWNPPPYEYEYVKLPIDILNGNEWLRNAIDDLTPLPKILERFEDECSGFEPMRRACLLYD